VRRIAKVLVRCRVLLWFVAGLAVLDWRVEAQRDLWVQYEPDDYLEKVRAAHDRPWDVLIVGGSPVSEGIDPAVLSGVCWRGTELRRAFNLGLPGGTAAEIWHAARHAVTVPPRLLIYGVAVSDLNDNRLEPHGPAALMDWEDVTEWLRDRRGSGEWMARHWIGERFRRTWALYHYRTAIKYWLADVADRAWPGFAPQAALARRNLAHTAELRRGDGYAPMEWIRTSRLDFWKATGSICDPHDFLDRYRVGEQLAYVHRLLDWAQRRNVSVLLLEMPMAADLESCRPEAFAIFRAALDTLEREWGVRVLHPGRPTVGLSDADFSDGYHVNGVGAVKLSHWLRSHLVDPPSPGEAQ
jgi:hypothetical protein